MGGRFKKKIHNELKLYFPGYFNDEETLTFYSNVKARILTLAAIEIEEGEPEALARRLDEIDRFFAEVAASPCFDSDSPDNAALMVDKAFESLCTTLESNGVSGAANLTAFQFYARLDHFKRLNQAIRKPAV